METQTTRTPSSRRASRPAKNTTAAFQVGPPHVHVLLPVAGFISAFTQPIVHQLSEPKSARASLDNWELSEEVGGEVNDAQTLEQTQAFLNLPPHLDSLAASKMDPPLPGF